MLAAFKHLQASGLLEPDLKAREQRGNPGKTVTHQQPPIFVRNDSGQTVPPYAFMQPTGTVNVTDSFCYVSVQKPIHSSNFRCPLLINGMYEIESGAYGVAQQGPVYSLLGVPGLSLGERLASVDDEWFAEQGSMYAVIGTDTTAIADDIYKVMFDTSSWRGKTKSGGLTAGTPGLVQVRDASGSFRATDHIAVTYVSDIAANTEILLLSQYGQWLALELC
jgi:hypothetical protein